MTYESAGDLAAYWSRHLPPDVEWVVVDNASRDGSAELAESLGARVVRQPRNAGFGAANNVGLAAARGRYVAFVNPDVAVDPGSLDALAREIDRERGLVAPQLLHDDGTVQPNGRGFPTLSAKVLNRLRPTGGSRYRIVAEPGEAVYVCWAIGAAVASRREWFVELGAWDERFFVYYEDSDQGMRAWSDGMTVRLVGDVRWVHGWARATTGLRIRPWWHELRSMAAFYTRYPALVVDGRHLRHRYPAVDAAAGRAVADRTAGVDHVE
ncbi:glycosyltransferase [Luteimicrobium subarcticum]|uniref:glycosyltransferase n=1 Tax=Luteimicrobium subarcticum TaxID=620910 RepID=UPI0012FD4C82|nr:glycosyltransferase [Luteimicrobium subarcticum]